MKQKYNADVMMNRIEILVALGFTICHEDSWVEHDSVPGVEFNFSATDSGMFLSKALKIAHMDGVMKGQAQVRTAFKELLEIE